MQLIQQKIENGSKSILLMELEAHGFQQRPRVSWHRELTWGCVCKMEKGKKIYQTEKSKNFIQKQALKE